MSLFRFFYTKFGNLFKDELIINKFIYFIIVGGFVSILDWLIFGIFTFVFNFHYIISTIISYIICTLISLLLTHFFVFNVADNVNKRECFLTFSSNAFALILTVFLMWFLNYLFNINKLFLRIIVTGIVMFYNFFIRYFIIYRK